MNEPKIFISYGSNRSGLASLISQVLCRFGTNVQVCSYNDDYWTSDSAQQKSNKRKRIHIIETKSDVLRFHERHKFIAEKLDVLIFESENYWQKFNEKCPAHEYSPVLSSEANGMMFWRVLSDHLGYPNSLSRCAHMAEISRHWFTSRNIKHADIPLSIQADELRAERERLSMEDVAGIEYSGPSSRRIPTRGISDLMLRQFDKAPKFSTGKRNFIKRSDADGCEIYELTNNKSETSHAGNAEYNCLANGSNDTLYRRIYDNFIDDEDAASPDRSPKSSASPSSHHDTYVGRGPRLVRSDPEE